MHDNAIFIQMKVLRTEHKRFELMRVPWVLIAQMAAGLLPQIEWAFVVKYYHVGKADALRLSGMFVTSLAVEIQTSYWPLSGKASGTDFEARPRAFAADTGEGRTLTKRKKGESTMRLRDKSLPRSFLSGMGGQRRKCSSKNLSHKL